MATKDRTSLKNDFANGKYATGEKFADLIDSMKVVQLPVVDPQALGTSLSFIDSISQDADGKITATKKTLDLENAHELNPFKGWYKTGDTLPTDGFDGAYLYFKDTSELTGQTTIYRWNGTAYADTGTVVDTSNVNTFETGQAVNEVKIKDEAGEEVQGTADVLSADAAAGLLAAVTIDKLNWPKIDYSVPNAMRPTGINNPITTTGYFNSGRIPLRGIKVLYLTVATGNASTSPCVFLDSSGTFISGVEPVQEDGSYNNPHLYEIVVPSNAVLAIFSKKIASSVSSSYSVNSKMLLSASLLQDACYISPNGNDANDGKTELTPVQSITVARNLTENTLYLMDGVYDNMNLVLSDFSNVVGLGHPIIKRYNCKIDSAELVEGTTKTYKVLLNTSMNVFIWQDGIPSMLIGDDERHPLHGDRIYRLPSTRIYKADSLEDLELNDGKLRFYYDGAPLPAAERTLYFNKVPNSDLSVNPIIVAGNNNTAISASTPKKMYIENIHIYYSPIRTESISGEFKNCSAGMTGNDAFELSNSIITLSNCEAYAAFTSDGGDGFNAHGSEWKSATIIMYNCWGHDNRDDGESSHHNCHVIQYGGLYEYNGAGCTPATGCKAEYYNTICRQNKNTNDWTAYELIRSSFAAGTDTNVICNGCIAEDNYGFRANYGRMMCFNCFSNSAIPYHDHNGSGVITKYTSQVQSDWTETDNTEPSFIKNKPQ